MPHTLPKAGPWEQMPWQDHLGNTWTFTRWVPGEARPVAALRADLDDDFIVHFRTQWENLGLQGKKSTDRAARRACDNWLWRQGLIE